MAQPIDYVAFISAFVTSQLATFLSREFLFGLSNHNEIWISLFLILCVYLIIFLTARNYVYNELRRKSLWWKSRQNFIQFLYSIVIFTTVQLLFETTMYLLAVTHMEWSDWMNFANFGMFFIFVLLHKLQAILNEGRQKRAEK
jgi:hypothetical protein